MPPPSAPPRASAPTPRAGCCKPGLLTQVLHRGLIPEKALRGKDQKRAERARSLRRAFTAAEFALWRRIRGRQPGGGKFVRQEPIDRYYVDFVCREQRLIVELDGGQHSERRKDIQRDRDLDTLGYRA